MTLIIGIVCTDGVVLAADSATTDPDAGTKHATEKIRRIDTTPVLYGGSGDVGLCQKIAYALEGFVPGAAVKNIRKELRKRVLPELEDAVKNHVGYPAANVNHPPGAILLFAGVLPNGHPWLLEIERNGADTEYDAIMGGFGAIGSGKPWAQAVFRSFLRTERELRVGRLLAYRVMKDSIDLACGFVAEPIRIYEIDAHGNVAMADADEMARLEETLGIWRQAETEALGRILAPAPREAAEPQIPTPQAEAGV